MANMPDSKPIRSGLYDVSIFAINKDTIPPSIADAMRWRDVVFENGGYGNINTADTIFRQRYKRGYFTYETDTLANTINFKK